MCGFSTEWSSLPFPCRSALNGPKGLIATEILHNPVIFSRVFPVRQGSCDVSSDEQRAACSAVFAVDVYEQAPRLEEVRPDLEPLRPRGRSERALRFSLSDGLASRSAGRLAAVRKNAPTISPAGTTTFMI